MIIVQISDFHHRSDGKLIRGIVDPEKALRTTIDHIRAMTPHPDVVLVTGDIHNKSDDPNYGAVRAHLDRLDAPYYVVPGNHDDHEALRAAFLDLGYLPQGKGFLQYVIDEHPIRLIGLDTVIPGNFMGRLCAERLGWLEERLQEAPTKPTLIFMHHPPFKTGIDFMDECPFEGQEALSSIISYNPQIQRLVCGHLHRPMEARIGCTLASTAPSIAFQMSLDMRPGSKPSFILEPAAIPVYLWSEDTGLVAHMSVIGDYGPRHAFKSETRS